MCRSSDKTIRLHPNDNVVVCIRNVHEGDRLCLSGVEVVVQQPISLGHKLACRPVARGETVIKYGVPIGSATRDIAIGELVHTHNIRSNYIATWLHE